MIVEVNVSDCSWYWLTQVILDDWAVKRLLSSLLFYSETVPV